MGRALHLAERDQVGEPRRRIKTKRHVEWDPEVHERKALLRLGIPC
jgi:hypothetical protein